MSNIIFPFDMEWHDNDIVIVFRNREINIVWVNKFQFNDRRISLEDNWQAMLLIFPLEL